MFRSIWPKHAFLVFALFPADLIVSVLEIAVTKFHMVTGGQPFWDGTTSDVRVCLGRCHCAAECRWQYDYCHSVNVGTIVPHNQQEFTVSLKYIL
ncbi:hypothetical protein V1523DRAFT_400822 [Lipomyces doorenjongii]